MAKIGFYAGSFSPVTRGHLSIVCEALNDYEKVIVGIGVNGGKKQEYTLDERRLMVDMSVNDLLFEYKNRCLTGRSYSCSEMAAFKRLLAERDSVSVVGYQGLTVDYALRCGATALIRGERIVGDHDGEMQASLLNKQILEVRKAHLSMATIPVPREDMTYVSSSNVRSLCALGEYVAARRYVTSSVHAFLMCRCLSGYFTELLGEAGIAEPLARKCYARLVEAYGGNRCYHTLSHVAYMLNYWRIMENLGHVCAENPSALALAVFYHDFVNDGKETDEKESCRILREVGADSELTAAAEKLIAATAHGKLPRDMTPDMALIHDLDLAVLGDNVNYGSYAAGIRQEYRQYDDAAYKTGRISILNGLLSSGRIFLLPKFAEMFETDACRNLQNELAYWLSR